MLAHQVHGLLDGRAAGSGGGDVDDGDAGEGYELEVVRGWDYRALLETYARVAATVRAEHVPAVVHVVELTQPFGHSTSGSHERYKSPERLGWEKEHDGLTRLRAWMLEQGVASEEEIAAAEAEETAHVRAARDAAWKAYQEPINAELEEATAMLGLAAEAAPDVRDELIATRDDLARSLSNTRLGLMARRYLRDLRRDAVIEMR